MKALTSLFASPVELQLAAPQLVETQQLSPGFTLQHWKKLSCCDYRANGYLDTCTTTFLTSIKITSGT